MINQNRKQKTANGKLFATILLLFFSIAVNAQWVTIPDPNFVAFLQTKIPTCMNGNQMDTTCPGVTTRRSLYPVGRQIQDLTGIQYFDSLDSLNCAYNLLTSLPPLRNDLGQLGCNNNLLTALPQHLPDSLWWLKADYNQFTSVPALPQKLELLWLSHNQLTSVPVLPPILWQFYCEYNQLTSLPALPATLQWLDCFHNQITIMPSFSTVTSTYLSVNCSDNLLTSLPTLERVNRINCSNNQITVMPPLSTGAPFGVSYLYCQSNQITSLPPFPYMFMELNCSDNPITTIPKMPRAEKVWCHDMPLLTTITELGPYTGVLDCRNTPNLHCLPELTLRDTFKFTGSGIACLPNYPPVTYSNPPVTSVPLCDDIFNPNGCGVYWNISGKTYHDLDGDCAQGQMELYIPNMKVNLYNNGSLTQQTYSGGLGVYSFDTNLDTFTSTIDTAGIPFNIHCPASRVNTSNITAADSTDVNMDFGLQCKPGFDVGVWCVVTNDWFFPGRNAAMKIHSGDWAEFWNQNCHTDSLGGQLVTTITGPVAFVGPAGGALTPTVVGNVLTYNISDWAAVNPQTDFNIVVQTNTTAQSGQQVCFDVTVTPTTGDNNTANNALTHCYTVVNSHDPNDKQVSPIGNIDTTQEWLTYTIRFQNTGSAAAQHIYVDDTLDASLDESTFQLLAYSHAPIVQLKLNAVRFNFPNINLPDSTANEPNSHGYVQYKVKLKANLPVGTEIKNTAAIYFDFNAPVITNTTSNRLGPPPPLCTTIITTDDANDTICRLDTITLTANTLAGVSYAWSTGDTTLSITVVPNTANTLYYSVTVTDDNSCVSTDTVAIVVNPKPNLFIGPPGPPVCDGDTTTLTAPAISSFYLWSTGDTTYRIDVSPHVSTSYSVTVTNSFGCSSVGSQFVVVDIPPAVILPASVSICRGDSVTLTARGGTTYAWSSGATDTITTVVPAATTTYTVTVTNSTNCTATASATVTVNQPVTSFLQSSICAGDSIFLGGQFVHVAGTYMDTLISAVGCDSILTTELIVAIAITDSLHATICEGDNYLFGDHVYASAGTYYDTMHTSSGCDSVITILNLAINALPQPAITQNTHMLTTGNFDSYQWLLEGDDIEGATLQELHVIQNGNYSVVVTDANGCTGTSEVFNVTGVGVAELTMDDGRWTMYPNPATNTVTISIDATMVGSTLVMRDITGKKMTEVLLITHNQQLNIESLSNGVYFVTVTLKEGGSVTRKLVK